MTKFLTISMLLLTLVLGLTGCGGNGAGDWEGDYPDNGIYTATYSRAGGSMTLTVSKQAIITITIVDDSAGTYTGSGKLTSSESFDVKVTNSVSGDSLTVLGSLQKSALSKKFAGRVQGAMTFAYSAPLAVGNVSVVIYAGSYGGGLEFRDFTSSDCSATIDSNGFVNVQFFANNKTVNLFGLVYSDGRVVLAPAEGEKQKFYAKGVCYLNADVKNLCMMAEVSATKDGKSLGTIYVVTPFTSK